MQFLQLQGRRRRVGGRLQRRLGERLSNANPNAADGYVYIG